MSRRLLRYASCLLLVLACCPQARAARPFVTDDARLTTAGSCQLESWSRFYSDSHELWALPACNPGGNLEFTAGGGRAFENHGLRSDDYVFQLKTLFRPLTTNDWGWGLGFGTVLHPDVHPGPNLLGNVYAYLPASFSFNDDQWVVHTNLGWLRDRASGDNRMTWGVGSEYRITPRVLGIAESFGDDKSRPYWQLGARFSVLPDLFQIDATVGQQFDGPRRSRWISFGLRLTPDKLF